jgi:hypothetical protein
MAAEETAVVAGGSGLEALVGVPFAEESIGVVVSAPEKLAIFSSR